MNDKVELAEAKAEKEKSESIQADKELKKAKDEAKKNVKYIALKNLATSKGNVKKGYEFTCNAKELKIFKLAKAV